MTRGDGPSVSGLLAVAGALGVLLAVFCTLILTGASL